MKLPSASSLIATAAATAALLCASFPSAAVAAENAEQKRPNVIVIMADDLGYADLSAYGHPYSRTPNLDRLSSQGSSFRNYHTAASSGGLSRFGFMTSRSPASVANYPPDFGFGGLKTVTELMMEGGYDVGHVGEWTMGPTREEGTYGIDSINAIGETYDVEGGKDAGVFQGAMDYLEAITNKNDDKDDGGDETKPFYLNVWGHIAHAPISPPQSIIGMFDDVTVDPTDFAPPMQAKLLQSRSLNPNLDESMRTYLADLYSLDQQIGLLLDKIDELGLSDSTIVTFSSTNGAAPINPSYPDHNEAMLGYGGELRGSKLSLYEGGVKSPFIVRWPGKVAEGMVDDTSLVWGLDWLPTICTMAGVEYEQDMYEGRDMSSVLLGDQGGGNDESSGTASNRIGPIYWKKPNSRSDSALLYGLWKLHLTNDGTTFSLYDLETNPSEDLDLTLDDNLDTVHPEKKNYVVNAILPLLKDYLTQWNANLPTEYCRIGGDECTNPLPFDPTVPPIVVESDMDMQQLPLFPPTVSPIPTARVTTAPTPTPKPKPNLLVILTDQQRFDAIRRVQEELNYPESARIDTPNLDRLIDEGVHFKNAYSHCAVCGPARTSLLSGLTIESTGVRSNIVSRDDNAFLPGNDARTKIPKIRTYDDVLVKDYDYVAEYYGKWHSPEAIGHCYSNDVRGTRLQAWFGKYEADNVTEHMSTGLGEYYRIWLHENGYPQRPPQVGEVTNTYSRRSYVPDPLDTRFGLTPDEAAKVAKVQQSDQHGVNTLPDGYSITAQRGMEMLEVLDRLHDNGDGEPFSLHVSFHSPHPPMIATPVYHNMYDPADMAVPASIEDTMTNSAYDWRQEKYIEQGYANASLVQRMTATYYGLITEIDEWIGQILDKLDELDLADNTLVAFSADHGEMLGSHGMKSKNVFYEESAHVPLILRFPGVIEAGTVVDSPVSHLDLHSTFLDYLGVEGYYKSDGSSLRKYIEGTDDNDEFVVTAWNYTDVSRDNMPHRDPAFMVRKGSWKLMLTARPTVPFVDMLYDLCTDPSEMNNLVGSNGETAADDAIGKAEHLKAMLVSYLEEANHPAVDEVRSRKKWRSTLFWVGDTVVQFRNPLPDGTRTEFVYIGAGSDADVEVESVSIEGNDLADRFSIDWDPLVSVIPGNSHRVISITYRSASSEAQDSGLDSANLVIKSTSGEDRVVSLLRPGATSAVVSCEPMTYIMPPRPTPTEVVPAPSSDEEADPDVTEVVAAADSPSDGVSLGHKSILRMLSLGLSVIYALAL